MTREYIRAVKSRYSKQQHQSIIEAYLFKRLPVEEIASNYGAGEMDITVILSSYRILMSCRDRSENDYTLKYAAERGDRSILMGQYVELYYNSDLADVSPSVYLRNAKDEADTAEQQKLTISAVVANSKKKKKRRVKNIVSVLVRVFAGIIFLSLIITLPVYIYNNSKSEGDKNPDLSVYVYDVSFGSYGGQGQTEPSGLGRLFADGYDYAGQFSRGKIKGYGCFFNSGRISYIGGVNNGKENGTGLQFSGNEASVLLGIWKNGELHGPCIKISDYVIEMREYSNGAEKAAIAIGNFKDINFNMRNPDYTITLENGYYRLGKTSDIRTGTGIIVEWAEAGADEKGNYTVYFNEYKDGSLKKSLFYCEDGSASFITVDFVIESEGGKVRCAERDGIRDLTIEYSYADEDKPVLFGKYENGKAIKLGKLLKSGEIVLYTNPQ